MEYLLKGYQKAKRAVEVAEDAIRDFHRWLRGILVLSSCYLETWLGVHADVIKVFYLINGCSWGMRVRTGGISVSNSAYFRR